MLPYDGPTGSTRMIRAPRSANNIANSGSGPMPPSSSTVTPASGPEGAAPSSAVDTSSTMPEPSRRRRYGSSGRSGAHDEPLMWLPPSTNNVLPVRYRQSSLARNTATGAMSS